MSLDVVRKDKAYPYPFISINPLHLRWVNGFVSILNFFNFTIASYLIPSIIQKSERER